MANGYINFSGHGTRMSGTQRMFCPQCGAEFFGTDTKDHEQCIRWGISVRGYKGRAGWIEACIANGRRVTETLSYEEFDRIMDIINPVRK